VPAIPLALSAARRDRDRKLARCLIKLAFPLASLLSRGDVGGRRRSVEDEKERKRERERERERERSNVGTT